MQVLTTAPAPSSRALFTGTSCPGFSGRYYCARGCARRWMRCGQGVRSHPRRLIRRLRMRVTRSCAPIKSRALGTAPPPPPLPPKSTELRISRGHLAISRVTELRISRGHLAISRVHVGVDLALISRRPSSLKSAVFVGSRRVSPAEEGASKAPQRAPSFDAVVGVRRGHHAQAGGRLLMIIRNHTIEASGAPAAGCCSWCCARGDRQPRLQVQQLIRVKLAYRLIRVRAKGAYLR